jgi:DNA-binding response OmpR family regulator
MEKAKILIVDDDLDLANAFRTILESQQYTVITAADKAGGMELIRTEKPDLLILDVIMSTWSDGFEMARELKKENELKEMPILMLTGVKDKTGIDFKSSAGDPTWLPVDAFLDKPVESKTLLAEVEKLLSNKAQ